LWLISFGYQLTRNFDTRGGSAFFHHLLSFMSSAQGMTFTLLCLFSARYTFEDLMLAKKLKQPVTLPHKNLHIFTPDILQRIGQLKNAGGGILATLTIPSPLSIEGFDAKKFLILDGVEDLGELGTLLRSASAFSWDAVWITHSCGDPFDPVCLRASQGALFDLPYRVGSIENALKHSRRLRNSLKLKLVVGKPSPIRIGTIDPDLSEARLRASADEICLLIQRPSTDTPTSTDFMPVEPAGCSDAGALPISVSGSALMYSIRDRYFNRS
jgi:hypothetical protein